MAQERFDPPLWLHVEVLFGKILIHRLLPVAVSWVCEWMCKWHRNIVGLLNECCTAPDEQVSTMHVSH